VNSQIADRGDLRTARAQVTLRDQLQLDDEVNSQIADRGDLRTARAQVTSVGDLRVHFVVEL
jgi:hypothetical protein